MKNHLIKIILCVSLTPLVLTSCASDDHKAKKSSTSTKKKASTSNKKSKNSNSVQSSTITPILSPNEADRQDYKKLREQKIIYFQFDQSRIQPAYVKTLRAHAAYLVANPDVKIKVEGHCDERGTPEYNIALGEHRSNATIKYLQRLGVNKSQMSGISYGEEKPIDAGHNAQAYAKNRRAVIVY